jgi:serine protease Do/serine protease DegQ
MIRNFRILSAGLLLVLSATSWAALPAMVNDEELPSLAPLVEKVSPAVVNIRVSQTLSTGGHFGDEAFRRFFGLPDVPGGEREVASAGSGVIVDAENGYILTNRTLQRTLPLSKSMPAASPICRSATRSVFG